MPVKWTISQSYHLSPWKHLSQLSRYLWTFPTLTVFSKRLKILIVQHFLPILSFDWDDRKHVFLSFNSVQALNSKDYTVSGLNCHLVQVQTKKKKVLFSVRKSSPFNIESWSLKIVAGGVLDKLKSQKSTSTMDARRICDRGVIKMGISSTHQKQ